jgi:hypothetical protein
VRESIGPNMTDPSIAAVACPSTEDVGSLLALLKGLFNRYPASNPTKTASNLLRAARITCPNATPAEVAEFLEWKLRTAGPRINDWGGMVHCTAGDFDGWRACRDARADVPAVREELTRLQAAFPMETSGWSAMNDTTALNILVAVRKADPSATPIQIATYARSKIIKFRFDNWGGVIAALRNGW